MAALADLGPTNRPSASQHISLREVGVKYVLLTDEQRTLKGRILNVFGSSSPAAEFWALRGLDLEIAPGEIVGLIGRNGSGKSTLMRVMARIIEPTVGRADVEGRVSPMIELGGALSPELSGRENVFLSGALFQFSHAETEAILPDILSFSELGVFFDAPVKTYSSGMIARLAFAINTSFRPEILLVDEALAVGDEDFQKKSFFRIRKLIDAGRIVVIVTHNLALLEQLCTRVVYLSKGRLAGDGTPRKVLDHYRREASY